MRQGRIDDRDAIAAFIKEAYGSRASHKGLARWTWQFVLNPFTVQVDGAVPVWIAIDDGRVVGQIAVQETVLQIEDEIHQAGWIVDVMVLPSHRGAGIGHLLYEAVAQDVGLLVTLTMAEATRRMAERLECLTLDKVPQFTRWARLDPRGVKRYLLTRTVNHPWARRSVGAACAVGGHHLVPYLVNPLLRLRDRLQRGRAPKQTQIIEVERFDDGIDELWAGTRAEYPVTVPRDARFLNWRFVECPELPYRRFVARRDGRTVGYVVLRDALEVELPEGHIVDLYASRRDDETIDALVRYSLDFFGDKVNAVDSATTVPEIASVLRRYGFVRTRTHRPTCVCGEAATMTRLEQLRTDWLLSKADHDWDQVHVAE